MRRATAGAKLLMRFASKIIDKYNALPEEERDINSILGHSIRMQVPHERARLADLVSTSFHLETLIHTDILPFLFPIKTSLCYTYIFPSVLIIAGHESTANSLSWIMVELARHPAVLLKGETSCP